MQNPVSYTHLVCFDIKELGKQLKKIGMLVIQYQVWNRVTMNRSAHKSTRYYAVSYTHLDVYKRQAQGWSDYTVDDEQIDSISYKENLFQNGNDRRTNGLGNLKRCV